MTAMLSSAVLVTALAVVPAAAHPGPAVPPPVSPGASISTGGDYATDVFGDPWDFSNDEDVQPIPMVGCEPSRTQVGPDSACDISRSSDGWLNVTTHKSTIVKLIGNWDLELPWGRDGELNPVDASRYSRLSFSMCVPADTGQLNLGIRYYNEWGQPGQIGFFAYPGCKVYAIDLTIGQAISGGAAWTGKIVRLDILSGGPTNPIFPDPAVVLKLDWVRLHRPDTPDTPPAGLPAVKVLTPNADGGNDYGGDVGNTWDMTSSSDALDAHQITNTAYGPGGMTGMTTSNDPYVEFPLPVAFNPDRYHRFSADLCLSGAMSFA
ncbi:MAG: hypothetical protein ABIQ39_08035, partial [Ilumatobacteraceae bacterium]